MVTDQTASVEPQAGDTGDPSPQAGKTTTTEPQAGDSQETLSLEELKKLRSESRALRDRLKASEAKANELDKLKADIEAANLSEKERLEKRLADLQAQHDRVTSEAQARILSYEVRLQAAAAGVNPKHLDKAARLLDTSEIEYDANGQPTNVKALLDALLKDMPELLGKASPTSGGATNPSRSQTSGMPTITHDYIARLTRDDYNALSLEQQQAISTFQRDHPHRF